LNVRINYRAPAVTSIGGRAGSVRSADGLLDLQVGIPKEMCGPGGKTNSEELFAARGTPLSVLLDLDRSAELGRCSGDDHQVAPHR
jgi:hypothetical protein